MPDEQDYRDLSKLIDDLIAGSKHYQKLMHGPETFFTDMDLTNQQKRIADTMQEIITLVKNLSAILRRDQGSICSTPNL